MTIFSAALQELQNVWYSFDTANLEDPLAFVIEEFHAINERLKAISTHPSKIEPITRAHKFQTKRCIQGTIHKLLNKTQLTETPPELKEAQQGLSETIGRLAHLSQLKGLESLKYLAEDLQESLQTASSQLLEYRQTYESTPQDELSIGQAIDFIRETFGTISAQLTLAHFGLLEIEKSLEEDLHRTVISAPKYMPDAQALIGKIYACFSSASKSLFFSLEEFHVVSSSIYLDSKYHSHRQFPFQHCAEAVEELEAFDRIGSLCHGLEQALENPAIPLATLLLNMIRLERMVEEGEQKIQGFSQRLSEALDQHQDVRLSRQTAKPTLRQELEISDHKRRTEQLQFTQEHIQDITADPSFLRIKEMLKSLSRHPRIASYLTYEPFKEPLRFETEFWLLKPLIIRKKMDCERIRYALLLYPLIITPLVDMLRGKDNPHPTFSQQKSPFITLGKIEEALFGISSI